ncbi:MAG: metallophosphoesterase [Candidatus Roizmanbacteria bacterium]|nr:metallophosphoesterase [Candidatus Roizmanbacteria bacterium]
MQPIRFLHISDTHLGPNQEFIQHDANTFKAFLHFLNEIKFLPFKPEFIIHTGDVTANCYEEGYKLMASAIKDIHIPFYFTTGNHDRSEQIKHHLSSNNAEVLSSKLNTYRFSVGDHHFMTLDGRGPNEIDPHGVISLEQMDVLKKELETGKQVTLFIHYPALPLDSTWFDENMLLTNGTEFHQLLASHKEQVRGVFFGHIHRSSQTFVDGILYSSVGSMSAQFLLFPDQLKPMFESTGQGYFNIVTIDRGKVLIKNQSFANGQELYILKTE